MERAPGLRRLRPGIPNAAPRRRGPLSRTGASLRPLMLGFVALATATAAFPGGGTSSIDPPDPPGPAATGGWEAPEGEWVRLVASSTSLPNVALPTVLAPTGIDSVLWAVPQPLSDVLDTARRSTAPFRLALEGGEFRLLSRYLPTWAWASTPPHEPLRTSFAVSLPPPVHLAFHSPDAGVWLDGTDYADPLRVGLPLLRVRGYEDTSVSAHFFVRDFATRDGAPFARIDPDLVAGLERMRAIAGPLQVISGYRHPRYNALPSVGGARSSRHQTGQAADVWSATESSVTLARAAVIAMGCGIGVGLGRNTVHVDVRGYLSTWTYPGAPLSRYAFDRWVRDLCGDAAGPPPAAPRLHHRWLPYSEDAALDDEETVHTSDERPHEAEPQGPPPRRPSLSLPERVQRDLADVATSRAASDGATVVVVDLLTDELSTDVDLRARARAIGARSPEALHLGLRPLLEWVERHPTGAYYIYAIRYPDGRVSAGVAAPPPVVAPPAEPAPATRPRQDWLVVITSRASLAGAEADLERYSHPVQRAGYSPVLRVVRGPGGMRYDVVAGPFSTEEAARVALGRLSPLVPVPPTIVSSGEPRVNHGSRLPP